MAQHSTPETVPELDLETGLGHSLSMMTPPPYEEEEDPPPQYKPPTRCPIFRSPPPGETYSLSRAFAQQMSCKHFLYHFVILVLFCLVLFLGIWVAYCEGYPKGPTKYVQVPVVPDGTLISRLPWETSPVTLPPSTNSSSHRVKRQVPHLDKEGDCIKCITTATYGNRKVFTLLHTNIPPLGSIKNGTCVHDNQQYDIYKGLDGRHWCSNPHMPKRINLTVYGGHLNPSKWCKYQQLVYINSTSIPKTDFITQVKIDFDVCQLLDTSSTYDCGNTYWRNAYKKSEKYLCYDDNDMYSDSTYAVAGRIREDKWTPCGGTWDKVCQYTGRPKYNRCKKGRIADLQRVDGTNIVRLVWNIKENGNFEESLGIGIDGAGTDPASYITIKQKWANNNTEIKWSVYDTLQKTGKTQIMTDKARNLFMEFSENVAKTLGVTNCFVCGGTNMGEVWPWEALEADSQTFNNLTMTGNITLRQDKDKYPERKWALTTNLIGKECYKQNRSNGVQVGEMLCLGYWEDGQWNTTIENYRNGLGCWMRKDFWGGIFRNWKQAAFMFGVILLGLLMLPCLLPLIRSVIQSTVESVVATLPKAKTENMILLRDVELSKPLFTMPDNEEDLVF